MSRLRGTAAAAVRWVGAEIAPIVLLPLAGLLVWVAIWEVWLPTPDAGAPSQRSETLAIVLLLLATGLALAGVFHDRLRTVAIDRTGVRFDLTAAERAGAHELLDRLAARGASEREVARAFGAYLRQVRSAHALSHDEARTLAATIAGRA